MNEIEELLERFRRAPEVLAMTLTGVFGEEVDFVPAPGKWSPRQIIRHLADAEAVMSFRFRSVIAEENPKLQAWDQNAWAANLDYATRKPTQSLDQFRRVRTENYELLKELPREKFERKGTHSERGELTLLQLVKLTADHAESHARQLGEVREVYKQQKKKAVNTAS
jgi:hypothetical protein